MRVIVETGDFGVEFTKARSLIEKGKYFQFSITREILKKGRPNKNAPPFH
jgi:hypothetical protein